MDKCWIDITTCEDGLDRVFMHEKTGQAKIVKPATKPERTILDDAYDEYWNSPNSRPDPSKLLAVVRAFTIRSTIGVTKCQSRSEDIAQEVAVTVFEGLETFSRADETAFTRWVRRTIKKARLKEYRTCSLHTREYEEASEETPAEESYRDVSRLPRDIRRIAGLMISGYSLQEIADHKRITLEALRKRIQRYRKKMSQN